MRCMKIKSELNWQLKSLLTFSLPVFKRKIRNPQQLLKSLPKAASDRFGYLSLRYNTHVWTRVCNKAEFRASLYALDILDRYLPRSEFRTRCLDIGSRKWSYLPGLCAYSKTPWDGVELDAYQRYITLDTRRAHAQYMLRACPDSHYISASVLSLSGSYPLITWFLPYLSEESFHASHLPERYFQPEALLRHALNLLAPKGRMLIVNQGEKERDLQLALFMKLGVTALPLGKLQSPFTPDKKDRYGWLLEKEVQTEMKSFNDILNTLPTIEHIERLELGDNGSDIIENRPGKSGSLKVYHAVSLASGQIGKSEAQRALELFAEHTEDARAHPGKHPNIDRLFQLIETDASLSVKTVEK